MADQQQSPVERTCVQVSDSSGGGFGLESQHATSSAGSAAPASDPQGSQNNSIIRLMASSTAARSPTWQGTVSSHNSSLLAERESDSNRSVEPETVQAPASDPLGSQNNSVTRLMASSTVARSPTRQGIVSSRNPSLHSGQESDNNISVEPETVQDNRPLDLSQQLSHRLSTTFFGHGHRQRSQVKVTFYVLAYPLSMPSDCTLYVEFSASSIQRFRLDCMRIPHRHYGYTVTVTLPFGFENERNSVEYGHLVEHYSGNERNSVEYRYLVVYNSGLNSSEPYERPLHTSSDIIYRQLQIPQRQGVWNQYDMLIMPHVSEEFVGETSKITELLELMLPDLNDWNGDSLQQIVECFNSVKQCIKANALFFLGDADGNLDKLPDKVAASWLIDQADQHVELSASCPEQHQVRRVRVGLLLAALMREQYAQIIKRNVTGILELCDTAAFTDEEVEEALQGVNNSEQSHFDSGLRKFMTMAAEDGKPQWLLAVPLLHMLKSGIPSSDCSQPACWEVDVSLWPTAKAFKKCTPDFDVRKWYGRSHTIRVITAALGSKQLQTVLDDKLELPVDACVARVLQYLVDDELQQSEEVHLSELTVLQKITEYAAALSSGDCPRGSSKANEFSRSWNLMCESLTSLKGNKSYDQCKFVVPMCELATVLHTLSLGFEADAAHSHPQPAKFIESAVQWISKILSFFEMANDDATGFRKESELQMWTSLLKLSWKESTYQELWLSQLQEVLQRRVRKMPDDAIVSLYYLIDFQVESLEGLFYTAAKEVSKNVFESQPFAFKEDCGSAGHKKFGRILCHAFAEAWKNCTNRNRVKSARPLDMERLRLVLQWPQFLLCVSVARGNYQSALDEFCKEELSYCTDLVMECCSQLKSGKVYYEELSVVLDNAGRFIKIVSGLSDDEAAPNDFATFLQLRKQEKKEFDDLHSYVQNFESMCQHLRNVKLGPLLLQRIRDDVSKIEVCQLWAYPSAGKPVESLQCRHFPPSVGLPKLEMLHRLSEVGTSVIFLHFWKKTGEKYAQSKEQQRPVTTKEISIMEVEKFIWVEAYNSYIDVGVQLKSLSATFDQITWLTGECGALIEDEVKRLVPEPDFQEVYQRIMLYSKFKSYRQGAAVILELRRSLKLSGNFHDLEVITNSENDSTQTLLDIKPTLIEVDEKMKALLDTKNVDCLEVFHQNMSFVEWVKDTAKEPKEVNVFADFCGMAAGEQDIYRELGPCFLNAVTGYIPLIYELPETCGLKEFLERCQALWNNVRSGELRPQLLNDCGRHLNWFKEVKQSLGAVEVTSLAQAAALNASGIYEVGFHKEKYLRKLHVDHELDRIVHVTLPETGKDYTYSQLTELHSKLMLVHRDTNKVVVDLFVQMYEGITNLAYAYLEARDLGTLLFDTWRAELYTNNTFGRKSCVIFSNSIRKKKVKKIRVLLENCPGQDHARQWRILFEECCKQWKSIMEKRREMCRQLNVFTTQQIVFLRRMLPALREEGDNSVEKKIRNAKVFGLLAMLVPCEQKKVRDFFIQSNILGNDLLSKKEIVEFPDFSASTLKPTIGELWAEVDKSGFRESLDYVSLLKLENILEKLQEDLQPTPAADLDQGESLSPSGIQNGRPNLPSGIQSGRPNLIICQEDEVLAATLSLYVPNIENVSSLPCPTRNEVLVCTDKTTFEEVDLLLERAFAGNSSVYCIAHAQRLGYDVCGHIERRLSMSKERGYLLAVICAEEYQKQSRIAVALERFKIENFQISEALRAYIRGLLGGNYRIGGLGTTEVGSGSAKGGYHAIQRSYAQLVLSECAGLGKTSYIQYVKEKYAQDPAKKPIVLPTIQLVEDCVDGRAVIEKLTALYAKTCETEHTEGAELARIIHINVAQEVMKGVEDLLFSLLILGSIGGPDGCIWQQSKNDYYFIEALMQKRESKNTGHMQDHHGFLNLLPSIECISPFKCIEALMQENTCHCKEEEEEHGACATARIYLKKFRTSPWQNTFRHLRSRTWKTCTVVDKVDGLSENEAAQFMLEILLECCGIKNPSWYELRNFVHFFDVQLSDCENSIFCTSDIAKANLPNFMEFVVGFMLLMSKDFATRSLDISDESPQTTMLKGESEPQQAAITQAMEIKRKWEEVPHPYIFFNHDGHTLTFMGFRVHWYTRQFIRPDRLGDVELRGKKNSDQFFDLDPIDEQLFNGLKLNKVDLTEDFSQMERCDRIRKLRLVMGTYDNFFQDVAEAFIKSGLTQPTQSLDSKKKVNAILAQIKERNLNESCFITNITEVLMGYSTFLPHDFSQKSRDEKVDMILTAIGNYDPLVQDPDRTYELTHDNVNKILAIYMRFRCGIPVIIMGETGCGKTRLVKFMCELQVPKGLKIGGKEINNLILVKVHGGTTADQLRRRIQKAQVRARENREKCPDLFTVLFLDEANTTSAIGLIKEVMCDGTLDGVPLEDVGLRIIAAVNPYRKHSEGMIGRLESAGLGYHVEAKSTTDRLGSIPMRHLVYRVRALPQSLLHLVWDFGQLSPATEENYIKQMIPNYLKDFSERDYQPKNQEAEVNKDDAIASRNKAVAHVLVECQKYMRTPKGMCYCPSAQGASQQRHNRKMNCTNWQDEKSFVSLRDIERVLQVMSWFYYYYDILYQSRAANDQDSLDRTTWSLVLAVGVCYQACLQPEWRAEFRRTLSRHFVDPLNLHRGATEMQDVLERCQSAVMKALKGCIPDHIALNQALTENIFIMVICIDLRIPLFLVGKPGSSKSLAKAIVAEAMRGQRSASTLFQRLKEVHIVSYQCSPLATPESIVSTFRQAANFQKPPRDTSKFAAVVVLDEIGLAEDSKLMPLKSLHHLLEEGCDGDDGDEVPKPYMKCSFIGISNWSLDPAKMNRGIMVQRGVPEATELAETSRIVCQRAYAGLARHTMSLSKAYLKIVNDPSLEREFFGLRDFYSLIKMLAFFANHPATLSAPTSQHTNIRPTAYQFRHAILRNFGGSRTNKVIWIFEKELGDAVKIDEKHTRTDDDPPCDAIDVIRCSLSGKFTGAGGESRYLLLLTGSGSVLNLVKQNLRTPDGIPRSAEVIFGSEFPRDLQYSQVCRNINRIAMLMETGHTVILLNLENLYESLYDALNQYYVKLGDTRFVELGLGTHRVKCKVHEKFRLVVIAEENLVRKHYPIPLINRLEKHYVTARDLLTAKQQGIADELTNWATEFAGSRDKQTSPGQNMTGSSHPKLGPIVGYSSDDAAALVLQACEDTNSSAEEHKSTSTILERAKSLLLLCATPEAILHSSPLADEKKQMYFNDHDSLRVFLKKEISTAIQNMFLQVTTLDNLLSEDDVGPLRSYLGANISLQDEHFICSLEVIETEVLFTDVVRRFYEKSLLQADVTCGHPSNALLIIQCQEGIRNARLLACAKHIISREHDQIFSHNSLPKLHCHVVLLIRLQAQPQVYFSGFLGGLWKCIHIDDVHPRKKGIPLVAEAFGKSFNELLKTGMPSEGAPEPRSEASSLSGNSPEQTDTVPAVTAEPSFSTFELLRLFWHEAASRIRDRYPDRPRMESLLEALWRLFDAANGEGVFQKRFTEYVVRIISLREGQTKSAGGQPWLLNVTNNSSCSFRRCFEKYLEKKLAPFFAEAIAFLDVNENLSLLVPRPERHQQQHAHDFFKILADHPYFKQINLSDESWKKLLWLQIFKNFDKPPDFIPSFDKIVNHSQDGQHYDVPIRYTSCSCKPFSGQFPFSWLIKDLLESLLKQTSDNALMDKEVFVEEELRRHKIFGEAFNSLTSSNARVAINYLHDLVHLVFDFSSEVYKIVFVSILQHAYMKGQVYPSVTRVHICYMELTPRLKRLLRLLELNIFLEEDVYSSVKNGGQNYAIMDSMDTDALALKLMLRKLMFQSLSTDTPSTDWHESLLKNQPIIEEMLSGKQDGYEEGTSARIYFDESREMWNRLLPVKIIADHFIFSPPHTDKEFAKLLCNFASKGIVIFQAKLSLLKDGPHMDMLSAYEEFVRYYLSRVLQHIYHKDISLASCGVCRRNHPTESVLSTCLHPVCANCLGTRFLGEQNSVECSVCKKPVSLSWDHHPKLPLYQEWWRYFKQQTSTCFMNLLANLVFAGHKSPEDTLLLHVVQRVFVNKDEVFITRRSNHLVDTSLINPTPALQFFLLQHLLRLRKDEIALQGISAILDGPETRAAAYEQECCTFVINRYQDYVRETEMSPNSDSTDFVIKQLGNYTLEWFERTEDSEKWHLSALKYAAQVRLCLVICADMIADYLHKELCRKDMECAQDVIVHVRKYVAKRKLPRKFLIRRLIQKHGISTWRRAFDDTTNKLVLFICPEEPELHREFQDWLWDLFAISKDADDYRAFRAEFLRCAAGGLGSTGFDAFLKVSRTGDVSVHNFNALLAISSLAIDTRYRNALSGLCSHKALREVRESMGQSWKVAERLYVGNFHESLTKGPKLIVDAYTDLGDAQLTLAIYHLCAALFALHGQEQRITSPLSELLVSPNLVKSMEIPLKYLKSRVDTQVSLRKVAISGCGQQPAAQAVLDIFLSMTLYTSAALHGSQHTAGVVPHKDPLEWLWKGIISNVQVLRTLLSKSHDDCVLFLNAIVSRLINLQHQGLYSWSTDDEYRRWEHEAFVHLLQPAFKDYDKIFADIAASDTSLTKAFPELLEDEECPSDFKKFLHHPAVWKLRETPSVDHFVARLNVHCCFPGASGLHLLQAFVLDRAQLSVIKFLPAIIKLIKFVSQEASLRLRARDVRDYTIKTLYLTSDSIREQTKWFIDAWNSVRQGLSGHSFKWSGKELKVPPDACVEDMSESSNIGMLLPGTEGLGPCALGLVTYLAQLQNDFLENVLAKKPSSQYSIMEATEAHVISFDPDVDLLPIILCNYHLDEGLQITYNFGDVQKQIMDRFVSPKAYILSGLDSGAVDELKPVVYREEVTAGRLLKRLCETVEQEHLTWEIKRTVLQKVSTNHGVLSTTMDIIEKALGFLYSLKASPQETVSKYLRDTLNIKNTDSTSQSILDLCHMKHVQALWLLLSFERTKLSDRQECFEGATHFRRPIPDFYAKELRESMARYNPVERETVLEVLHKFLRLELLIESDAREKARKGLFAALLDYTVKSQNYSESTRHILNDFSKKLPELRLEHAVQTWMLICSSLAV